MLYLSELKMNNHPLAIYGLSSVQLSTSYLFRTEISIKSKEASDDISFDRNFLEV